MAGAIAKGVAMGGILGFLLFELATGLLLFYGLGSGHGVDFAGAFVIRMTPTGAFALSVGPGYLIGALAVTAVFSTLFATMLAAARHRQRARA